MFSMNVDPTDEFTPEPLERRGRRQLALFAEAVRATWRVPFITAILLGVLIVAGFMLLRFALPSTTITFISRFQFTFPDAQTGRYPNNAFFTINEILDPVILDLVYNELGLSRFGVKMEEYYSGFFIRRFATNDVGNIET